MDYKVTFNWTTAAGEPKSYYLCSSCREVGISNISDKMRHDATSISAHFHHQSTPYAQEIAEAFGLKYELVPGGDAFGERNEFVISGNDDHILPAWYWIVLALRYRGDEFNSFQALLERCTIEVDAWRQNDYSRTKEQPILSSVFYRDISTADDSLQYWKRFIEEKDTPTTAGMLKNRSCIISYFYRRDWRPEYYVK